MPELELIDPVGHYLRAEGALRRGGLEQQAFGMQQERLGLDKRRMGLLEREQLAQQKAQQIKTQAQQRIQARQILTDMGKGALWADTPQKWDQMLDTFETTGADMSEWRDKYELRPFMAALATGDQKEAIKKLREEMDKVQSSKILPGGVTQIVRDSGKVDVIPPDKESEDIIKRAEERGIDLQQKRAQSRKLGKDAAKISTEVFGEVGKLRENNVKLKEVIQSVEAGAGTGPLKARLPSFRTESVRLDNMRNRLGLDVIGSVTFGALSEGEMNMALDTALPDKLTGPELVKWAQDKIAAQEKLANYLEDQSIFLSKPGNTPAGWLEHMRSKSKDVITFDLSTGKFSDEK